MRGGIAPAPFDLAAAKKTNNVHGALQTIVKQLTYKNSAMLPTEEAVQMFIAEAMATPESVRNTKAYTLVAIGTNEEGKAFQQTAAYAMQQGDMSVKYGVCTRPMWDTCRLGSGEARLVRHDLPDEYKEEGVRYRYRT